MLLPANSLKPSAGLPLAGGLLTAAYQPIRRLDRPGHPLLAIEALARWRHPVRGPLRPDIFVPVFGETGLGQQLLCGMVRLVADTVGRRGQPSAPVCLNIDPDVTGVRHWHRHLLEALAVHQVPTSAVWVELTERVDPAGRAPWWYAGFEHLADAGVRLIVDDVGAGFDRTELLYRLPVHGLKLDRAVVNSMCASIRAGGEPGRRAAGLLRAYARWCADNQVLAIAEGIATEQQLRCVLQHGWTAGQGLWLGRPTDTFSDLPG
ncbi:EAL domain-containing protein [Nakamurella aerolata]|uniref:EAL domain-containing protein n=1 Tax=Nakamurella aerolata TaxID=1656892 RepID=A0A849A7D1_9ACTN|nr:EAL domain-containing protein [Nakamurella aerolata]NNG36405.1 EAL domain-containing protein [Nakamurella aerolata]